MAKVSLKNKKDILSLFENKTVQFPSVAQNLLCVKEDKRFLRALFRIHKKENREIIGKKRK